MSLKARPLAAALAGLALAASAAVADPGKAPAPGAPAAPAASVPGKPAPDLTGAVAGRAPKGYVRVAASFTATTGAQTRGLASCPAGTVPFGGGVFIASTSINI